MNQSQSSKAFKQKLLKHIIPDISEATAETIEILADIEQVSTLLNSLSEAKSKQIVSFQQSFMDLQDTV